MVTIKVEEWKLVDLLTERVGYWTDDQKIINLYSKMYENNADSCCFEGIEFDVNSIVDNDYVNYCTVLDEEDDDFKEVLELYHQGEYDISCETRYGYIEAVSDDEKLILVRY